MIRFTIRDVLWLTVVVGLVLGWLVHGLAMGRRVRSANGSNWKLVDAVGIAAAEWAAETNREVEIKLPDFPIIAQPDGRVRWGHYLPHPSGSSYPPNTADTH